MSKARTWTDEQLIEATKISSSVFQVVDQLALNRTGGNHSNIKRHIKRLNLDTTHFLGQGHMKGKSSHNAGKGIPLEMILVENSSYSRHHLKRRLLNDGLLESRCYICNLQPEWNNLPLVMRLDHKNGIYNDNRLDNLWLLCPNCDSQQPTFAGRNRK